ncbi:MAG: amidohydrolase family protein [Armatimonadota bacterium]|nr:amidohydrolase family protein [Armatimonadota bacterium]MDR7488502.1 amidohydrolase family protein [Armatimonadota bacterium]MDR7573807.1 amidohydrolase family protein [Armatimonadota bacterium]
MSGDRLDLRVLNGTLVDGESQRQVDLGVKDGVVVLIGLPGTLPAAREEVDAHGLLILPGLVDSHVHIRAPERPDREDFASGTAAAAAGGVTTIFEMPVTTPCCASPEVLRDRMALAARTARVDVAFYAALGDLARPRLREMADLGAVAFKIFLHAAPPGRHEAFDGLAFPDPADAFRALQLVQETGPCAPSTPRIRLSSISSNARSAPPAAPTRKRTPFPDQTSSRPAPSSGWA